MSLCSDCKRKDHCDERDQLDTTEGCGDYQQEPDYKAINADLLAALEGLLERDERETCQHETTHRGGSIWTICDNCDAHWADDRGGKPDWQDPPEWIAARAAIAKAKGGGK